MPFDISCTIKSTVEFLENNKKFNNQFLIGDPFFIDSMLQSMQVMITPRHSRYLIILKELKLFV